MNTETHETLYTKDSIGNTRIWFMERDNDRYRTVSGILDGAKVTSEWTVAEGKNSGKANETSGSDQAIKEINAKYKKQLKSGYVGDVGEINDKPKFIEPMLAKKYIDYQHKIDFEKEQWLLQCKFNGNRCVATKDGLFTRTGEKYLAVPHLEEALKPFFIANPEAILDGELFNEEYRQKLNEIAKLVRRTVHFTPEHFKESEELVRYYVYDGYNFGGYGMSQSGCYCDRKKFIDEVVSVIKYIKPVKTYKIKNKAHMEELYNSYVEEGHEGVMLRLAESPYENKRSKNLLKFKPEMDDECVILDILEGQGNWSGAGKTITIKWKDKVFDASFKGTYEESAKFLEDKEEWIGKTVTFLYNDLTGLGVPNYARIDYNNCVKTDK